ncbi:MULTISPECIES: DUF3515 family protein [Streptomyces]|uniref:DUF3515 family protein n=1 Tax=Streptomyces TaxID=1883 RepID=UPI0003112AD2|nr:MULTISPECIES: DUF3515 family protein [Streptomyces]
MDHDEEVEEPRRRTLRGVLTPARVVVAVVAVAVIATALLVVDSRTVDSAPRGGDARCSEVVDRLPDEVGAQSRDWVIGDGVAAWGDRSLVLRCGVGEPEPTTSLCLTAEGVDWVLDERTLKAEGVSVLTTYGRSPAVEITYDGPREDVGGILVELKEAVARIPQGAKCIGAGDTL